MPPRRAARTTPTSPAEFSPGPMPDRPALTDEPSQIVAARGFFGGEATFFVPATSSKTPRVASSLTDALAEKRAGIAVDERFVASLLTGTEAPRNRTVFQGLSRLHSGESLVCVGATTEILGAPSFASRAEAFDRVPPPTIDQAACTLRTLLERRIRFAAQGSQTGKKDSVAVLAGGGLDSSAIVALAAGLVERGELRALECFAVDFDEPGDDRSHLRALESALRIDVVRVDPRDAAPLVRSALVLDRGPNPWPTGGWDLYLARLCHSREASVVLTGAGSDDVLDGGLTYFQALARAGHPFRAFARARALRGPWRGGAYRAGVGLFLRPWLRSLFPLPLRRRVRRGRRVRSSSWFTRRLWAEVLSSVERVEPLPALDATDWRRLSSFAVAPEFDDRADARRQLEVEAGVPYVDVYLDESIGSFLASLPPDYFFDGDRVRGLLRRALPDRVPTLIRERLSKGVMEPGLDRMILRAAKLGHLDDVLELRELSRRGWVNREAYLREWSSALRVAERNEGAPWMALWPTLACEAFLLSETR